MGPALDRRMNLRPRRAHPGTRATCGPGRAQPGTRARSRPLLNVSTALDRTHSHPLPHVSSPDPERTALQTRPSPLRSRGKPPPACVASRHTLPYRTTPQDNQPAQAAPPPPSRLFVAQAARSLGPALGRRMNQPCAPAARSLGPALGRRMNQPCAPAARSLGPALGRRMNQPCAPAACSLGPALDRTHSHPLPHVYGPSSSGQRLRPTLPPTRNQLTATRQSRATLATRHRLLSHLEALPSFRQ